MENHRKRHPGCAVVACLLAALTIGPGHRPAAAGSEAEPAPGSFLQVEDRLDAKCAGLQRGRMRFLRNHHPELVIRYRLARYLAGRRQPGLLSDRIEPGPEGQQDLGCELLSGLEQTWRVVRASFQEERSPPSSGT